MKKGLPLKNEYLLLAVIVCLLLVCYQLAFKRTIEAWALNRKLKQQISLSSDLSYQPDYLERKNKNLDRLIGLYRTDTVLLRSNVINTIAMLAQKQGVKLTEVPGDNPFFHTDKFVVQKLVFEADFFALNRLLNLMETTPGVGQIRSVAFRVRRGRLNNEDVKKLSMEVLLETLK